MFNARRFFLSAGIAFLFMSLGCDGDSQPTLQEIARQKERDEQIAESAEVASLSILMVQQLQMALAQIQLIQETPRQREPGEPTFREDVDEAEKRLNDCLDTLLLVEEKIAASKTKQRHQRYRRVNRSNAGSNIELVSEHTKETLAKAKKKLLEMKRIVASLKE